MRKSALTSLQTPSDASFNIRSAQRVLSWNSNIFFQTYPIPASIYKPLLLASLSLLASATDYKHFDCGTDSSAATKDFLHTVQSLHSNTSHSSLAARAASLLARDAGPITVPAIFHIVTSTAKKNGITPQMAQDQMRALNGAYNAYNIRFSLANLTWTINDAWAIGATSR